MIIITDFKKRKLSAKIIFILVIQIREHILRHNKHLAAVQPQSIESAAFNKTLERPYIHRLSVNTLAEVVEALIWLELSALNNRVYKLAT